MLLTDRFVYVHQPKTGGTFATDSIRRLYGKRRAADGSPALKEFEKHAPCSEIPASHRGLPVLSTFRSPWSRYVSQYHFAWWKQQLPPAVDREALEREYPSFPEISFAEYVALTNRFLRPMGEQPPLRDGPLGLQSTQFVKFFFTDPKASWGTLTDAALEDGSFLRGLHPVRFLRQERLNADLAAALAELGFSPAELAFIGEAGTILPHAPRTAKRPDRPWREFWTADLVAEVRRRERLLWKVFPDLEEDPRVPARGSAAPR